MTISKLALGILILGVGITQAQIPSKVLTEAESAKIKELKAAGSHSSEELYEFNDQIKDTYLVAKTKAEQGNCVTSKGDSLSGIFLPQEPPGVVLLLSQARFW